MIPLAGNYPQFFGLVVAGLSTLGTVLGVILSGLGKRGDQKAKNAEDDFKRMMEETAYWHQETVETRKALAECEARNAT